MSSAFLPAFTALRGRGEGQHTVTDPAYNEHVLKYLKHPQ